MNFEQVIQALAALAHKHRLAIFRRLVHVGPSGLSAGAVGREIGIGATSTSFHLKELERAGLLISWRNGRSIRYAVCVDGVREVLTFMTEDCCLARPELCGAAFAATGGIHQPTREREEDKTTMRENRVYNVLFLCTGNSARSIIAECVMNRLGRGRFRGFSAGSQPRGEVHPYALDLLRRQNYPVDDLQSKSWDTFAGETAPVLDFVFTVCDNAANEVCPVWPGQPMSAHWGLPDPAAATGTEAEMRYAFADTHRMLFQRIGIFVNLPMESLDRLTLQHRLDEIGTDGSDTRGARNAANA